MSNSARSGLGAATITLALAAMFFIAGCPEGGSGTVADYLDTTPEIPENRRMRENQPAPDFSYATIDGRIIRLSDYIGDKPVVLDFWATTCPPCMRELPTLQEFYERNGDKVEIIAISSQGRGSASRIRQIAGEKGLEFPVMHDPSRKIASLYPTRFIPFLVFIDVDGTVVGSHTGYDPGIGDQILRTFGL